MKIKSYDIEYLDSLNVLLKEAFGVLKEGVAQKGDRELIAVINHQVVGYLALNRCINMITGDCYFYVNYVCVKKEFQGRGIACQLFDYVDSICQQEAISYLELTSNSTRVAAHHLYAKLGFLKRDTTVFRREIL